MRVPAILDRAGFEGLGKLIHRRTRLAMRRCSINWLADEPDHPQKADENVHRAERAT
jgi:hypothetical protein